MIDKKIIEDIQNVLNEELSVSNEVLIAANTLKEAILKDKKNNGRSGTLPFKYGNLIFELFGKPYEISYRIFTCNVEDVIDRLVSYADVKAQKIILTLVFKNGQPYPEIFDNNICHEVLHVFQYERSKKDMLANKILKDRYDTINSVLRYGENVNSTFAHALYATFDFEQDAMMHGMYGELMSQEFKTDWKTIIIDLDDYRYVYDMEWCLEHMDLFDEKCIFLI